MHRRNFLHASLAATATSAIAAVEPLWAEAAIANAASPAARMFEVTTTVDLAEPKPRTQLWLPVFQSAGAYQKVLSVAWEGAADARLVRDPVFGAPMLVARWEDASQPQRISLVQRVATWDRSPRDAMVAGSYHLLS